MLTDVFGEVRVFVIHDQALFQHIDLLFTVGHPTAPLVLDSCERECTRHVGEKCAGICKVQFLVTGIVSAFHSEGHAVPCMWLTAREALAIYCTLCTAGAKELQKFWRCRFLCELPRLVLWIPLASCCLDAVLRVKGAAT